MTYQSYQLFCRPRISLGRHILPATFFLNSEFCNALIRPHFDYACSAWYTNLDISYKKKLQVMQNKCIRFCLKLGKRSHVVAMEFNRLNWLPVKERFKQCLCINTFKFFIDMCPLYLRDVFHPVDQSLIATRKSVLKLSQPLRQTNYGQRTISYLAPKNWNDLPDYIKLLENTNLFKHKAKEHFFQKLKHQNNNVYILI